MKKKELAVLLSQLEPLQEQNATLEQYQTEGDIAANILWDIYMQGHIEGKIVADFGCGNGILGIGALLLGAKKVLFIDIDKKAITLAKKNKQFIEKTLEISLPATFYTQSVLSFSKKVDVIIQNPPFGVQQVHADKQFLTVAMRCAPLIYSFHKVESQSFLKAFTKDHDYKPLLLANIKFPLKKTQQFHKKSKYFVNVGIWRIERFKNRPKG